MSDGEDGGNVGPAGERDPRGRQKGKAVDRTKMADDNVRVVGGEGKTTLVADTSAPDVSNLMSVCSMRVDPGVVSVQADIQTGQTTTFRLRSGQTKTFRLRSGQTKTVNPMLRSSGPSRPPDECIVVDIDIAMCSTDEQLPPTAPEQLLQLGVCTQSDWERWSASFAARQMRCQCLPGCAAWMFALLIIPIVAVARRDRAYYKGDAHSGVAPALRDPLFARLPPATPRPKKRTRQDFAPSQVSGSG